MPGTIALDRSIIPLAKAFFLCDVLIRNGSASSSIQHGTNPSSRIFLLACIVFIKKDTRFSHVIYSVEDSMSVQYKYRVFF